MDSKKVSGKAFESIGYVSENQQLPGWMRVGAFLSYLRPFYPTWDRALEDQLVHHLTCRWIANSSSSRAEYK